MPHCVSSRYVLSHYSKCKDHVCPVCGPVREAIRRNFERSKEVVKLSSSSTNVARPSDGIGNGNGNNNMQGFSYPGAGGGGDYPLEFGNGFANGFATNPMGGGNQPHIESAVGPAIVTQKVIGKKAKKEKPDKPDKRDGSEGPPAKKIRSTIGAKVGVVSTAAPSLGQVGNGHISSIPDNINVNNYNNDNMKAYAPYIAQGSLIQHNQMIPNNSIQNTLIVPPTKAASPFPLDPVSCALYNFSAENVNDHFKHIHEGMKITTCRYVHNLRLF